MCGRQASPERPVSFLASRKNRCLLGNRVAAAAANAKEKPHAVDGVSWRMKRL